MKREFDDNEYSTAKESKVFYPTTADSKDKANGNPKRLGTENISHKIKKFKQRRNSKGNPKKIKNSIYSSFSANQNSAPVSQFISEGNPNTKKDLSDTQDEKSKNNSNQSKLTVKNESSIAEPHDGLATNTEGNSKDADNFQNINSDEKLKELVQESIKNGKLIPRQENGVLVSVEMGYVIFQGTVSSEEIKQNITDKAISLVGAGNVKNYLQVLNVSDVD